METISKSDTEFMVEGCDPARWKVPDDVVRDVVRGELGRFLLDFGGELKPGATEEYVLSTETHARVLDLVIDDPAELVVTAIVFGRTYLAIESGGVPASLFAAALCGECRVARCRALVGNRWPAMMPGIQLRICVLNEGRETRRVRGAFVAEECPRGDGATRSWG